MTVAAFFDIDGTIFRNSLMIEHFKRLMKYEVIDPAIWYTEVQKAYMEWERRFGDFEEYLESLAEVYLTELKGVDRAFIEFIADHVIRANGDMVYTYSRDQIAWHKAQGHKIFFISGSPDFLVSRMAEKYDITDYQGTDYLVDKDNKLTGELIPMWGSSAKEKVLYRFIEKYKVDVEESYAYGDTTGDLSMLRMMGHPVAINPNLELLIAIKEDTLLREKTKLIVERKNVIYELDANVKINSYKD